MKFDKVTLAVGGVVGVLLAGGLTACSGDDDGGSSARPAASADATTAAAADASPDSVSASGTVESARVKDLSFVTGGVITDIAVKAGKTVKKGALLATVDSTEQSETVSSSYSAYVAAQDSYNDAMDDKKLKDQRKQLYAKMIESRNGYNDATRALAGTKIYAPFSGTVTAVSSTEDAEVQSGTAVLTLTDLTDLQVTADFSEADTTRLKQGQKAKITFDSLDKTISGKVTSVAPTPVSSSSTSSSGMGGGFQASDTTVVQYEVHVSLSSLPKKIRTGLPVTVEVTTG